MSYRKLSLGLIVLGVLLLIPSLAFAQTTGPVTVQLTALNSSGETGSATLTDMGNGQTKVDVTVTGEASDGNQPMHIHSGQCGPTLGPVVYPLTNVVNGASTTTITATLASLMNGNFAINGHKSVAEIQTYVFCGNIPAAAAVAQTTAPTAAATAAATTAPTAAAAAPAATATTAAPSTAPTTGSSPLSFPTITLILALLVLGSGLVLYRYSR